MITMQLKDVTPIIKAIIEERDKIPLMRNTERDRHGDAMRGGIRKALRLIEIAPVLDAVIVVRCKNCANSHVTDKGLRRCRKFNRLVSEMGFCSCGITEEEYEEIEQEWLNKDTEVTNQ